MSQQPVPLYDVFVSHSPADREWVDAVLLPHLEKARLRVAVDYRDFIVGMPRLENVERAVRHSRRTIVVITPDWLGSEWNALEALLVRTLDPAGHLRKLLPILLKPCDLPDPLAALERVDLTAEHHWERQIQRLTRDIEDEIPVPPPWSVQEGGIWDLDQWQRWLRRYRRRALAAVAGAFTLWLVIALLLEWGPFQQRESWQEIGHIEDPETLQLVRIQEVLLLSTTTSSKSCEARHTGLWRSTDQGSNWQYVAHEPLKLPRAGSECIRAAIPSFAHATGPTQTTIYAATNAGRYANTIGLLRSTDLGETWPPVGGDTFGGKNLQHVVVLNNDPDRLLVAVESFGMYGSGDGGKTWKALDGASTCPSGSRNVLPAGSGVRSMLAVGNTVYAGTEKGLYASNDGGDCWERQGDDGGYYGYEALAAIPGKPGQLLAITVDFTKNLSEAKISLQRFERGRGLQGSIWASGNAARSLYVDPAPEATWYVVDMLGHAHKGGVEPATQDELPRLTRCFLFAPFAPCNPVFAADAGPGPPLLLARERVYRLGMGPWYRSLWP